MLCENIWVLHQHNTVIWKQYISLNGLLALFYGMLVTEFIEDSKHKSSLL